MLKNRTCWVRIISAYVLTVAATAAGASAPAEAPVDRPFAMRGVELGITLEEFRVFAIPQDDERFYDYQVRCTAEGLGDALQINWRYLTKEPGVINCGWFARSRTNRLATLSELWVDLGSGRGAPQFQFVTQDGKPRLFRISVKAYIGFYDGIPDALTRAYGPPVQKVEPFQVMSGATFSATSSIWRNRFSSISLVDHCEELNRYCLTYEHTALKRIYDAIVDQRDAAAASKI